MEPKSFGTSFQPGTLKTPNAILDLTRSPVLHDTMNIRTDGDNGDIELWDVTVLNIDVVDTVVVVDYNDKCVKSFFTKRNQARSSLLKLQYEPITVTHLTDDQVAVTYLTTEVTVVSVNPDLELHSRIITQKKYRCLTVLDTNTLAAGWVDPPSVDILDLSGNVHGSMSRRNTGLNLMKHPWYLCTTNQGHILVSDTRSKSFYCLTPKGHVVFTCHPQGDRAVGAPRGITDTLSGDILVVDYWNHKVIHLTDSGKFVKDQLTSQDGLLNPLGICLHGDRLFLTQSSQGTVKVLHFR